MITVVSMSPAIDKRLEFDTFCAGETNRVRDMREDGAGKGVHVALGLAKLSVPVQICGTLSEGGEPIVSRLKRHGVAHDFVRVPGKVRINQKLWDRQAGIVTEVNEPVPEVPPALLSAAENQAVAAAQQSEYIVLSGSLPTACLPDFYANIIRRIHKEAPNCRAVLDADGERLRLGIAQKPFLIKPNLRELEEATGEPLASREAILRAARAQLSGGAEVVVVSCGGDGAYAVSRQEALFAPVLPVEIVTTTGAGDALVSGLLCGFVREGSLSAALRHGIASATARCAYGGDSFIDTTLYQNYMQAIHIEPIA